MNNLNQKRSFNKMNVLLDQDNPNQSSKSDNMDIQIINEPDTIKKIKMMSNITKQFSQVNPTQQNDQSRRQFNDKRNPFQIDDVPANQNYLASQSRRPLGKGENEDGFMKFDDEIPHREINVKEEIIIEDGQGSSRKKEKVHYEFNSPINPEQEILPVHEEMEQILNTIEKHSVIVISGNTGCGKSTQIPKFIACKDTSTKIIVTQPRRVAAIALAQRVSEELKSDLGKRVGYQIGQDSKLSRNTQILYVTIGIFLQKLVNDPDSFLREYTHIILDEVHERGIESDFGLIALKTFLSQSKNRNTIKLIVMSATLNKDIFLNYFSSKELDSLENEIKSDQDCQEFYFDSSKFSQKLKISNKNLKTSQNFKKDDGFTDWGSKSANQTWNDQESYDDTYERIQQMICRFNCKYDSNLQNYVEIQVVQKYKVTTVWLDQLKDGLKLCNKNYFNARKPELNEDLYRIAVNEIKRVLFNEEEMLKQYKKGDILVFLPGYNEIVKLHSIFDQLIKSIKDTNPELVQKNPFKVMELHSCLGDINTKELLGYQKYTKIILATNIAESSITIPNCFVVFDFCLTKEINYNPSNGIEKLELSWSSKASITQRAGRTGRNCHGINIRFIPKKFFEAEIRDYQTPEILRCPIEKVILKIKILDEGESDYKKIQLNDDDDVEQNNLIEEIIKEKQQEKTKKKRLNFNLENEDLDYMKSFETKPIFDGEELAYLICGPSISKSKGKKQQLDSSDKLRLFEDPVRVLQRAIEAPDDYSICQSMENLISVGALKLKKVQYADVKKEKIKVKVTKLGRFYNDLPCDIKLAKFICFGYFFDCLVECISIASIYSQRKSFFMPFQRISNDIKQIDRFTEMIFQYDEGQESDMLLELKIFKEWERLFFLPQLEQIQRRREVKQQNRIDMQGMAQQELMELEQSNFSNQEVEQIPLSQQLAIIQQNAKQMPKTNAKPTLSFSQYLPDLGNEEKPLKGLIDRSVINSFKMQRFSEEEKFWCRDHFCDPKVLREILSTREDLKLRIPKEAGSMYDIFEFKDLGDDSHLMKIKFCLAGAFNKYTLKSDIFDIKDMQKIRQYLLVEQMDPLSTIIIENTVYGFQCLGIKEKQTMIEQIKDAVNAFCEKRIYRKYSHVQSNHQIRNQREEKEQPDKIKDFVSKIKLKYSTVYIEFQKFPQLPILLKEIMTLKRRYFNFIKLQDKDNNIQEIPATQLLKQNIDFDRIFIKQQNTFKYAYEAKLNLSNSKLNRLVSLESDSINLVTLGDYNRHKYLVASELMCRGHRVVAQGITVMPPNQPLFLAFAALIFGSQCYVNCDKDGKKYDSVNVDNVEIEIDHYMLDNDIKEINDIRRELRACLDEDSFFNGQANLQLDLWNKVKTKLFSRVTMRHVDSEKWEDIYCKEYLSGQFQVNVEEQNKLKVIKILESLRTTTTSTDSENNKNQEEIENEMTSAVTNKPSLSKRKNVSLLFKNHKRKTNQDKTTHASEKGFMNQILQTKKSETNFVTLSEQENINLLQEYFENYNLWKQMKIRELKKFYLLHTIEEPYITCKNCFIPLFKACKLQNFMDKVMKISFNGFTDNLYVKDIKFEEIQLKEIKSSEHHSQQDKVLEQNKQFIKELRFNLNQFNSTDSIQIENFKYFACQNGHIIGFTQEDNQLYNEMLIPDCEQLLILYPDLEYNKFSNDKFQESKMSEDKMREIQENKAMMLLELEKITCVICDCVMSDSEKKDEEIKFQDQNIIDWRPKLEKHMKTEQHKLNEEIFLKSTRSSNYFFTN